MVFSLGMALEVGAIEIDLSQVASAVALGLIVKVRRRGMAALTAGGNGSRPHAIAKLDHGDEAVSAGAIPFRGSWVRARPEGCQRSPRGGRETDRNARL